MKNKSILFISLLALFCFVLYSCKNKDNLDVLEGTWKYVAPNESVADVTVVSFVFDGKGKYIYKATDFDGYIWSSGKGSYSIESNNTIVRTHGVYTDAFGNTKEWDSGFVLDMNSTPPTLSCDLYDMEGTFVMTMVLVKQ